MTNEYFLYPLPGQAGKAARIPFPETLTLAERDAYMTAPPAKAISDAAIVDLPTTVLADEVPDMPDLTDSEDLD